MEENKKILKEWTDSIKDFPKLKINDAKKLYQMFLKEKEERERKKIREELIVGTLYILAHFINSNPIFFIKNSSYDMSDVINACVEEWIQELDQGLLLKYNHFSMLLGSTFFMNVTTNLIGNHFPLGERTLLTIKNFVKFVLQAKILKDQQERFSYQDFVNILPDYFLYKYDEEVLLWTYNLLTTIINLLKVHGIKESELKLNNAKYLLINIALEWIRVNLDQVIDNTEEERIIDKIYYETIKRWILSSDLKEREKEVLIRRYGLDDNISNLYEDIAKDMNVTKCRIQQIETHALRKLRHPSRLQNIKIKE